MINPRIDPSYDYIDWDAVEIAFDDERETEQALATALWGAGIVWPPVPDGR